MYIKYYALQFIEKWAVYGPDSPSLLMYTQKMAIYSPRTILNHAEPNGNTNMSA